MWEVKKPNQQNKTPKRKLDSIMNYTALRTGLESKEDFQSCPVHPSYF